MDGCPFLNNEDLPLDVCFSLRAATVLAEQRAGPCQWLRSLLNPDAIKLLAEPTAVGPGLSLLW